MSPIGLKMITPKEVSGATTQPVSSVAARVAAKVLSRVRDQGEPALREYAEKFGDVEKGGELFFGKEQLADALSSIDSDDRALLERVASRIETFAIAQLDSICAMEMSIPGGRAGHAIAAVERAGCYAPGGRFPLPSSVLMTAVTARAAGVDEVWVASPRPAPITLAAAAVAGAKGLMAAGGAQAIAGMTFGVGPVLPCDAVVGPGNKYVTAAKQLVAGHVAIDMLAGPSELTVLADETGNPQIIAADLLAQAEHDSDAVPVLVTSDPKLVRAVNSEIEIQLADLPTAEIAVEALKNGFAVVVKDISEGISVCDRLAPEHLEIMTAEPKKVGAMCRNYGGLFVGESSAEVLGDYGAGPNHTLPTGGTARNSGGLSVFDFLRIRTWLEFDDQATSSDIVKDAISLARLEGLEGHARSARLRLPGQ